MNENTYIELIDYCDLSKAESNLVLSMRNHPEIRKWMYNTNEIEADGHQAFIQSLINDDSRVYFLVKQNEEPIGTINFVRINRHKLQSEFGLYANPFVSIPGIGRVLEEVSLYYAFEKLKLNCLKLEVYAENKHVVNLHKKYKFSLTNVQQKHGRDVICMELEKSNSKVCING